MENDRWKMADDGLQMADDRWKMVRRGAETSGIFHFPFVIGLKPFQFLYRRSRERMEDE